MKRLNSGNRPNNDASVELASDSWAVDIMEKSMTSELKTLLLDDLENLGMAASDAITMFDIMTNRMVLRN